jgi:rubrerythrin
VSYQPKNRRRLYERHAAAADTAAWSVERDIPWADVDVDLALERPDILAQLRDAALIESFHPANLTRLTRLAWDDVDACVAFALEGYEGFKHFHALRTYLEAVDYSPPITDEEIVQARKSSMEADIEELDVIRELVDFMLSEHLAYYFFRRLAEQSRERVLVRLLRLIAADEVRHAQSASDLIAKRIEAEPANRARVLDAATHFRHFGEQAVGPVPVALPGDPAAISSFARRIERLCGVRLVDHLKATL